MANPKMQRLTAAAKAAGLSTYVFAGAVERGELPGRVILLGRIRYHVLGEVYASAVRRPNPAPQLDPETLALIGPLP